MKGKRPKKVADRIDSKYPSLQEFGAHRRTVLKGIALGAVSLGGGGFLSGCLDAFDGRSQIGPDGGITPERDSGHPLDGGINEDAAVSIDTGEPPVAGGMPTPDYWQMRLPAEGYSGVYLAGEDYAQYAVLFMTYDQDLYRFYEENRSEGLDVCLMVLLREQNCEAFETEQELQRIRSNLKNALLEHYWGTGGSAGSTIESVELIIDSCEWIPMAGDFAPPDYP